VIRLLHSTDTVGRANVNLVEEDITRKVQSWAITQKPPKMIGNSITWVKSYYSFTQQISSSVPTEKNLLFTVGDLSQLVGLCSFFDQYCIYEVVVNVTPEVYSAPPASLGSMITALDFDSISNVGSFANLAGYESASVMTLTPGQSQQRLVRPTVLGPVQQSSSYNVPAPQRTWVSTSSTAVSHYGFRSYFINNEDTILQVAYDMCYIVGFRNNI
jgi:hypothetical protein